jgi:predicted DNA-binding transcriptional regulator YafY
MTDSPQTLFRQWTMLAAVPTGPRKIDVARLRERLAEQGFETTARTIQRDLQKLSAVFPLVCDERSRPFGWYWMKDAQPLNIPAMTPQTALTLRLAREYLTPVLPPSTLRSLQGPMRSADRVLAELTNKVASWPDKVRVISPVHAFRPPDVRPDVMETVYTAVLDERAVTITYRKRAAEAAREYRAHPLAVVLRDNVFYVVAALWDYDNVVQLALHRVDEVTLDGPRRKIDFDLDDYIARGEFGFLLEESIDLVLDVDEAVVPKLAETPLGADQQLDIHEDGTARVTVSLPDTRQLRAWILSYGCFVEVVGPAGLRAVIAAAVTAASARYS